MQVRCLHCNNPIQIPDDQALSDIVCSACGSRFSLIDDEDTIPSSTDVGKRLGHFQLLERLGSGAFGTVWMALDTELDRTVAIKIPRKNQLGDTDAELFLREARAAAQIKHPNIVTVHEIGRTDETLYIVSDFVEGVTLADWLSDQQLSAVESAEMCEQISRALHHAHESGVVHRDLKPSNIMLSLHSSSSRSPHIMDFGLARREAVDVTVTTEGKVLGTPAYMSPEQASGDSHQADCRSDIYSLGVILFELLTGERPFRGNLRMLLHHVVHDDPPSPRRLNHSIPRDLETICLKCLEKDPKNRYTTAEELADELRRFLTKEPIHARPLGRVQRGWRWCQRNPRVALLTGTIALLLLAIAVGSSVAAVWLNHERNRVVQQQQRAEQAEGARRLALLDSVRTAAPQSVPFLLDSLRPAGTPLRNEARDRYTDAKKPLDKFRLACVLAALGEPKTTYLVSVVPSISQKESLNLIAALKSDNERAIPLLERASEDAIDLEARVRYGVILIELGRPAVAKKMLQLGPQPHRRTAFIEGFASFHGSLETIPNLIRESDDPAFRSGMCQALGSIEWETLSDDLRLDLAKTLSELYQSARDGATHGTSMWTLRQWGRTLPRIQPGLGPTDGKKWFVNTLGMTLLRLEPGTFTMGNDYQDHATFHEVTLSKPYYIGSLEVTLKQFQRFLNDPKYPRDQKPKDWVWGEWQIEASPTEKHPVQSINFYDALQFCNWLSHREGFEPVYRPTDKRKPIPHRNEEWPIWEVNFEANGYRLPTEAEWEYALRAGTRSRYFFGDNRDLLLQRIVYRSQGARPCGSMPPNAWGLFDMAGNVTEWVWDWFAPFPDQPLTDPRGAPDSYHRVIRGGCHYLPERHVRNGDRNYHGQILFRDRNIGFRVVLPVQ